MNRRFGQSVVAIAAVLALSSSVPAAAASVEDEGLWYFDRFKVQDAHDAGVTGEGVTIAMIDGPVNPELPTLADADIRVQDPVCIRADGTRPTPTSTDYDIASHGTAVLSLLAGSGAGFPGQTGVKGLAPDATVLTYYVQLDEEYDAGGGCPGTEVHSDYERWLGVPGQIMSTSDELGQTIHAAIDAGADIISVSLGAAGSPILTSGVARAIREGVIIVGALPNEGVTFTGTVPATSNGVVAVNNFDPDGVAHPKDFTDVTGPGRSILHQGDSESWESQSLRGGTSLATPIVAGNLALAKQKYPGATANQLIQSLIRNTGAEPHDLAWDPVFGYGIVITDRFLAVDPTQYPDVNPLVSDFLHHPPAVNDIWFHEVPSELPLSHEDRPWPVFTPEPEPASPAPSPSADNGAEPTASSTASATDNPSASAAGWLIPAIIIGVVLLLAIAIAVTIVVVRANRPTGGSHGTQ